MSLLPIVERELLVASRRPRTYYLRPLLGGAATLIVFWMVLALQPSTGLKDGTMIFNLLIRMLSIAAMFLGAGLTADSISSEKRQGTLGLLFLTNLRGFDVVTGKLVAHGLNACFGFLATFPALAVCFLLGGISWAHFLNSILGLLNCLFFGVTAGLFISAVVKNEKQAMNATPAVVMTFWQLIPLSVEWFEASLSEPVALFLKGWNPEEQVKHAQVGGTLFWNAFGLVHVTSWFFFFFACWRVPRSWQEEGSGKSAIKERVQLFLHGDPATRSGYRARMLEVGPIFWLFSRSRYRPHFHMLMLILTIGIVLFFSVEEGGRGLDPVLICLMLSNILHAILKVSIPPFIAQRVADDLKTGAMELLLSTGVGVQEMLAGIWAAVRRQFVWGIIFVLIVDLVLFLVLVLMESSFATVFPFGKGPFIGLFCAGVLFLLGDIYVAGWLGIWGALRTRDMARSSQASIVKIYVMPMAVAFLLMTPVLRGRFWEPYWMLGYWVVTNLAFTAWLVARLPGKVRGQFRTLAAEPTAGSGVWGKSVGEFIASFKKNPRSR